MRHFHLLSLLFLSACMATGTAVPEELQVVELSSGQHARAGEQQLFALVTTPEQLATVWRQIGEAPPAVDFSRNSVIVLLMGRQRSGGHAIAVSSVVRHGDVLQVTVQRRIPGAGCMTTMALTAPFQAVLVPARAETAEFVVETEAKNCQ